MAQERELTFAEVVEDTCYELKVLKEIFDEAGPGMGARFQFWIGELGSLHTSWDNIRVQAITHAEAGKDNTCDLYLTTIHTAFETHVDAAKRAFYLGGHPAARAEVGLTALMDAVDAGGTLLVLALRKLETNDLATIRHLWEDCTRYSDEFIRCKGNVLRGELEPFVRELREISSKLNHIKTRNWLELLATPPGELKVVFNLTAREMRALFNAYEADQAEHKLRPVRARQLSTPSQVELVNLYAQLIYVMQKLHYTAMHPVRLSLAGGVSPEARSPSQRAAVLN